MEQRVLIVSNRLPVVIDSNESIKRSEGGGLVNGMEWFHQSNQKSVWIGSVNGSLTPVLRQVLDDRRLKPIEIENDLYLSYYEGFCNSTLWPLCHEMLEQTVFQTEWWDTYCAVNYCFADVVLREANEADIVWIQDYHLMLLPAILRHVRPNLKIAFFLHIPFPPVETFTLIPWAHGLIKGVLGADMIGFHTRGYAKHFSATAESFDDFEVIAENPLHIRHSYGEAHLKVAPLGIDADGIATRARTKKSEAHQR